MTNDCTSLGDDEEQLRVFAVALGERLATLLAPWLGRCAARIVTVGDVALVDADWVGIEAAAVQTAAALLPDLNRVLLADVDAAAGSPLSTIRRGTDPFTAHLEGLGLAPVARDAATRQMFPTDLYDFGPASFADIDDSLHELGLQWGAARAHVHLRRRRDAEHREP